MINNESEVLQKIICRDNSFEQDIEQHPDILTNRYICSQIEIVRNSGLSLFYRIEGNLDSENILILYNGAYSNTIERKSEPVYQRCTWVADFDCLVINIDDPTIRLGKDCVIGWGQGTLDDYFSVSFNYFLQKIYKFLRIEESRNRIHFGSSAGGYQAVVAASLDYGSRAIVCNPQIDWTKHFLTSHVDRLRNMSFKGFSVEALQTMYPDRCNCITFAKKHGNIPSIDFYVNAQFAHDITNQLGCFIDELGSFDSQSLLKDRDFEIYITHASRGHNPPSKDETISYVKRRFI